MMKISFTKMQAAGNDYILFDNAPVPSGDYASIAKTLSHRRFSIGADGVVFLEKITGGDRRMRIFNPDGSEAEMCGNGARCVGGFLYLKTSQKLFRIQTMSGDKTIRVAEAEQKRQLVSVNMGTVVSSPVDKEKLAGKIKKIPGVLSAEWFSAGNPHLVLFVDEINQAVFREWGPLLEKDPLFPNGTNVEFVSIQSGKVLVRVWERGVGETLACGTGACAVFKALQNKKKHPETVEIHMPGGILSIKEEKNGTLNLSGPVYPVFEGRWTAQNYAGF